MSIGNNPTLHARTIMAASAQVGAKLPADVTDAYDRTARITADVQRMHPGQEALALAVVAALDAGQDPAADPEVARVHLAAQLANQGLGAHVENIAQQQMLQTFAKHADAIVKAWARPFDKGAAALAEAHAKHGGIPLDDTAAVVARGGSAAEDWASARTATGTVEAINDGWLALAQMTRLAPVDPQYPALRFTDVTAREWTGHALTRHRLKPWEAVSLGPTLSLPTMTGYRARVAALVAELAAIDDAAAPVDRQREAVSEWASRTEAAKAAS